MHRCSSGVAALVIVAAAALPLSAQRASPWLPPDHWSRTVLTRMHAAGLHGRDPAVSMRTLDEAYDALPARHRARLAEERLTQGGGRPPLVRLEGALVVDARRDGLRPGGFDLERNWTGPHDLSDRTTAGVRLRAESVPLRWLAIDTEIEATDDAVSLEQALASIALDRVGIWAGRRRHGYAPADGGGFVLDALGRFDGAGIHTLRPFTIPLLGRLTGEIFAGSSPRNGHIERPWLLAMRLHVRPHPRLDIGATRAAVFGRLDGGSIDAGAVAGVLVGANLSGEHADDQVASLDARWRPPLAFPLELHAEWGMHDIDFGVLFDVPAITVGVRLPDPTGTSRFGAGIEFTSIAGSCCANPPWYHHFEMADGWTRDGRLLGHPLGGQGRQWRLGVDGDAWNGTVLVSAAAMLRRRDAENLFAPDREGNAVALELAGDARLHPRGAVELALFTEFGEDWMELRVRTALRWRL